MKFFKYLIICLICPIFLHAQINIGTASTFGVLGSTTVTNTGPTVVTGDLGVTPGTSVTGFPPGVVIGTIHINDAAAVDAKADALNGYNAAAALPRTATLVGDLGGLTLIPGVYFFATSASLTGTLILDAQGNPNAQFVFQIGSTLITASGSAVVLLNGAVPSNIFWQVGSSATFGTGSVFEGNILANTSITVTTGVSNTGSLVALNGAVTLDTDIINAAPEPPPPLPPTNLTGSVIRNKFEVQVDRINHLQWTPSESPLVVEYILFRNSIEIAIIPGIGPFQYNDHNRGRNQIDVYTLIAVDSNGFQSTPVSISITN
jgi:hypothetical protein